MGYNRKNPCDGIVLYLDSNNVNTLVVTYCTVVLQDTATVGGN